VRFLGRLAETCLSSSDARRRRLYGSSSMKRRVSVTVGSKGFNS